MEEQNPDIKSKSLRMSFIEGVFASAMLGFTQDYFTPFLLLLGGTVRHVGILGALPNLISSIVQFKIADITDWLKSRKKIVTVFVLMQAVTLIPMTAIALSAKKNIYVFICWVILFTSFGALANPPWRSIMSDLVEEKNRGRYFGWRNKILGFIIVGSTLMAGVILYLLKKINPFYGFTILFGCAFLWRMISWYFMNQMYEPPLKNNKDHYFTLYQFIKRLKESNFAKFVIFVSLMNLCVNISSPFCAVLMLRELRFNYLLYTVITVSAALAIYFTMGRWGKHADKVGNMKIIKVTSFFMGLIPLLWVVNQHPLFLFCIQIFAGFIWAGFNLCTSNFIYDAVIPEKRMRCIAYFNMFTGVALCIGSLLGGFLLRYLPVIFKYKILTLFLISAALRLIVSFLLIPLKLKEVRPAEDVNILNLFLSMFGIKQISTA